MTIRLTSRLLQRVAATALASCAAIGMTVAGGAIATAAPACPTSATTTASVADTITALRERCGQAQFDTLFRQLPAGALPVNVVMDGQVRPLGAPNPAATAAAGFWQGKHFYNGWLNNRAFGGEVVAANVRYAPSTIDGKRAIRVDYGRSGLGFAHDELRRLPNGVYLGYGFLGNAKSVNFWVWRA